MIKLDKSQITRNLGKKYKYIPYLEKAIAEFDDEWQFIYKEKEHDHHWHPSSHCLPPVTDLYAIARGEIKRDPISGSLRKTFQVGHFWHQWLQHITLHKLEMCKPEAIERVGKREWGESVACGDCKGDGTLAIKVDSKRQMKPMCTKCSGTGKYLSLYHSVAGSGDIAPLEAPGWTGMVDYKTTSSHQFNQPGPPRNFADKYEAQMQIYLDLFEQEEALIVLINKNSPHDFREILYRRNQPLIDKIISKWEFVSLCLDAEESPTLDDDTEFLLDGLFKGPVAE